MLHLYQKYMCDIIPASMDLGILSLNDPAIICIQKPSLLENLLLPEAFFCKISTFPAFQISLGLHCSLDIISTEWHATYFKDPARQVRIATNWLTGLIGFIEGGGARSLVLILITMSPLHLYT